MEPISLEDARAQGFNKYFTGEPCKHGHIAQRKVSNRSCCECQAAWNRTEAGKASGLKYALSDPGKANTRRWQQSEAGRESKARYHQTDSYKQVKRAYNSSEKGKRTRYARHVWRMENDLQYRVIFSLRASLGTRLRRAKSGKVSRRAEKYLGCTVAEFISQIESQWLPSMTWENQWVVWQIDHIKPLGSFDLTDPAQVRQAQHHTNLQPLHIDTHREKSVSDNRMIRHYRSKQSGAAFS